MTAFGELCCVALPFCCVVYIASPFFRSISVVELSCTCIRTFNQILKVEGPGLYSIPTAARSVLKGVKYYIVPLDDVCE